MEREDLVALLRQHDVPLDQWGQADTGTVEGLNEELEDGEVTLSADPELLKALGFRALVRIIHTALIRTYVDIPGSLGVLPERKVLVELKRQKDGVWLPRSANNDEKHLSEKIRFLRGETREEAVLRCLIEELDLRHRITDLPPTMPEMLKTLHFYPPSPQGIPPSLEVRPCRRYPGFITRNVITRGAYVMPYGYYRPEYKERDKEGRVKGVFRWQGVARKDPIPALYG